MEGNCPECGTTIGGTNHELRGSNRPDQEFESFYSRDELTYAQARVRDNERERILVQAMVAREEQALNQQIMAQARAAADRERLRRNQEILNRQIHNQQIRNRVLLEQQIRVQHAQEQQLRMQREREQQPCLLL
jgi:hypothetical protein